MPDTTWNILFGYPVIVITAIGVAAGVVALLMLPGYFIFKSRQAWLTTAVGSLLVAILTVMYGVLAFSRFALLYEGHTMLSPFEVSASHWWEFVGINAILAAGVAILGGGLGKIVELLAGRGR